MRIIHAERRKQTSLDLLSYYQTDNLGLSAHPVFRVSVAASYLNTTGNEGLRIMSIIGAPRCEDSLQERSGVWRGEFGAWDGRGTSLNPNLHRRPLRLRFPTTQRKRIL